MIRWTQRLVWHSLLWRLGLSLVLGGGVALGGCSPGGEPTLPPATVVLPKPPTATAPELPTATPEQPTATVSPTETGVGATNRPRQAVTVTILHTNDVFGETYPCG